MRRFGYFVLGILVGATLKAEFKLTVQEVAKPDPKRGVVQLTQYIQNGVATPNQIRDAVRRGLF